MRHSPGPLARRDMLRAALLVPATAATVVGAAALGARPWRRRPPELLCEGVVVRPDGVVHALAPGEDVEYAPGTRVDASAHADLVETQLRRREGAVLPQGRRHDLAEAALADLLTLTGPVLAVEGEGTPVVHPTGDVVASPVGIWRYTWPRDASFAAAAFSAAGLPGQALAVLSRLAGLQRPDGGFEARYTADGAVPDSRPAQSDGAGWVLWAAARVLDDGVAPEDLGAACGRAPALAAADLMTLTDSPSHLPPASPDYWEVEEHVLTLGTAAAALVGLESAAVLARAGVDTGATALRLEVRAQMVRAAMERAFAPGWGRHVRGDDVDAAITLVGPPFTRSPDAARGVRAGAVERLRRANGGLGPGEAWRDDGVAWTPETALLAWSAAALGRREEADELLDWLDAHRTAVGALPEKVRADGRPAGPAPLSWTCALVLLATLEADRGTDGG